MKKQLFALGTLSAILFASCQQDEIAQWKIKARNDGLMSRTFKADSSQSDGEGMIRANQDPAFDDDYYQFNGPANSQDYIRKAVRYQGKKLKWPSIPQVTKFNWSISEAGNPYSSDMGGNEVMFSPSEIELIISVRPIAPGQRWQKIWLHSVQDGVGMNGVTP